MAEATLDVAVLDAQPPAEQSITDDTLSKMAGEEIDRLLADTEAGQAGPPSAAPAAPKLADSAAAAPTTAAEEDTVLAKQLDDLIEGLEPGLPRPAAAAAPDAPEQPVAAAPAPEVPATATVQAVTETTVPDAIVADAPIADAPVAEAPVADAPVGDAPDGAAPVGAAPVGAAPIAEAPVADEAEAAEEARLKKLAEELELDQPKAPPLAADHDPIFAGPAAAPPVAQSNRPLPVVFKPLVWINAPVANSPDWVRSLMGMAAIVMLVNAVLLIVYVTVFRKHH